MSSWNPEDEKTKQTIQEIQSELPQFDEVSTVFALGSTEGFSDLLDKAFFLFDEDMRSVSFETRLQNDEVPRASKLTYDAIYINGFKTRRILPSIINWATSTQAKYIFIDKTHNDIVNERYYRYLYKARRSNHTVYCHFRYNDKQMITVLKRYDI